MKENDKTEKLNVFATILFQYNFVIIIKQHLFTKKGQVVIESVHDHRHIDQSKCFCGLNYFLTFVINSYTHEF